MAETSGPMVLMILLNLPIFLAGATSLIAGLMLKLSSGLLEPNVLTLLDMIKIDNVSLGKLSDATAYLLIIVGVIIMVIGVLGIWSAWAGTIKCLWAYIIIVMVLLLLQITIIGLLIFMRKTFDDWFKGRLLDLLESYEGPEATDDVSKGWNTLFMEAECCGVNNQYDDGGTNNDFSEVPANWWANRVLDNVPATCCEGVTEDTISKYIGKNKCPKKDPPKNFYVTGCYHRIVDVIKTYSLAILLANGIILIVQVFAIVLACMLVKTNKVDSSPRDDRFENTGANPGRSKFTKY